MSDLHFNPDSILVDYENVGRTRPFYSSDSRVQFARNYRIVDPKYTADNVEYKFNKFGYRTCEPSELKERDFILVFGCSYTEGVGLHEEDIWCSQLCNELGIQKFNLGKASSGPDIQYLNTLQYVKSKLPTPKMVIYQWPETTRRAFSSMSEDYDNQVKITPHTASNPRTEKADTKWFMRRYCGEPGEREMLSYTSYTVCNQLWGLLGVPVYNWTWQGDYDSRYVDVKLVSTVDTGRARDMSHDGSDIHSQVVSQIKPGIDRILKSC